MRSWQTSSEPCRPTCAAAVPETYAFMLKWRCELSAYSSCVVREASIVGANKVNTSASVKACGISPRRTSRRALGEAGTFTSKHAKFRKPRICFNRVLPRALCRLYAFNNLHPNSRVAFDEIMDTEGLLKVANSSTSAVVAPVNRSTEISQPAARACHTLAAATRRSFSRSPTSAP